MEYSLSGPELLLYYSPSLYLMHRMGCVDVMSLTATASCGVGPRFYASGQFSCVYLIFTNADICYPILPTDDCLLSRPQVPGRDTSIYVLYGKL